MSLKKAVRKYLFCLASSKLGIIVRQKKNHYDYHQKL
ncbi:MAG: hypothetical protein UR41_C0020G0002 [Candidatus Woesebacteria bacterium GW2011_GWA1_33_33]|nr:MAG: hypothetical protein UR41_C0020G0002 [Candidatus Woesebacteria bacterium GW2011_GWA1_33_33]